MPTSNLHAAPIVLSYAHQVLPRRQVRVLDVGPGHGKYGLLFREYVAPEAHITAVEAWAPYVSDFNLEWIYDQVIVGDIRDQPASVLEEADITLMVDVVEHMPVEDGLALIARIPGWVIVCTPRDFFHNPAHCPPPEKHVSLWTVDDLRGTGRYDCHDEGFYKNQGGILARLKPR